jgi:hypothetical protein
MKVDLYDMGTVVNKAPLDELKRRMRNLNGNAVYVGWPDSSPLHRSKRANGSEVSGPLTVAMIAAVHEFGSERHNLPARPILGMAIRKYKPELGKHMASLAAAVANGKLTEREALARLGVYWEGRVKKVFTDNPGWQDIQQKTKDRKHSTGILIDTGHLRQSVTSIVTDRFDT